MTFFTQRHEVALIIGAAIAQRQDVVHLLRGRQPPGFLALLADRMLHDKAVTDTLPGTTVSFVCLRLTLKMIVMMLRLSLVLRAVDTIR